MLHMYNLSQHYAWFLREHHTILVFYMKTRKMNDRRHCRMVYLVIFIRTQSSFLYIILKSYARSRSRVLVKYKIILNNIK